MLAILGALALAGCQSGDSDSRIRTSDSERQTLELGRHLVEDIGLCADCHTPRLPNGEHDRGRWLKGAPIGFKPNAPMPWAETAPPMAILAAYTDDEAVKLFTQGVRPNGTSPRPPMPGYRFTESEARAIVAHLRKLEPAASPVSR